jgi:hypothetical protein
MRKSPQSLKPLHIDFSASPACLAEGSRKGFGADNLTALRVMRKVPAGRTSLIVAYASGSEVRNHSNGDGKWVGKLTELIGKMTERRAELRKQPR